MKILKKINKAYWAFYRWFRDNIFQPVWYRVFGHKFHIVRTKLTPSPWYDSDVRILYSVMAIVEWFVENDMRKFTEEEFEAEIKRIKEEDPEHREGYLESWRNQQEENNKIIEIYNWWKNYPKREKKINEATSKWYDYVNSFCKEDIMSFFNVLNKLEDKEKSEADRLSNISHDMELKLRDEEQEMLKRAIDLRDRMWS